MYGFRLPMDFLIGTANSAFQSEGAWDRDGKSENIMEYYGRKYQGTYGPHYTMEEGAALGKGLFGTDENARGCEFYDLYEEYIEDMKKTGQNTFRMSLAWPRIIPNGVGEVNQAGIDHYNKVIDKLIECGGNLATAKEKGLIRSEGKEYVVKDGDVMHFLFNV